MYHLARPLSENLSQGAFVRSSLGLSQLLETHPMLLCKLTGFAESSTSNIQLELHWHDGQLLSLEFARLLDLLPLEQTTQLKNRFSLAQGSAQSILHFEGALKQPTSATITLHLKRETYLNEVSWIGYVKLNQRQTQEDIPLQNASQLLCHELRIVQPALQYNIERLNGLITTGVLNEPYTIKPNAALISNEIFNVFKQIQLCFEYQERLTNHYLLISKLSAGALPPKVEIVYLKKLLQSVHWLMHGAAYAKALNFHLDLSECHVDSVLADEDCLTQILMNIISNAIKFTNQGFIKIKCITNLIQDQVSTQIDVQDTGIGMPDPMKESLLQTINQANRSHAMPETDLGINIVHEMMHNTAGEISYASRVGQGTTVSLKWSFPSPLQKQDEGIPNSLTRAFDRLLAKSPPLQQAPIFKALIIEDNPCIAQVLKRTLQAAHIVSDIVHSPEDALSKLRQVAYDVLLMDVYWQQNNTAFRDGFALTEFIRQEREPLKTDPHIPILAVAGCNEDEALLLQAQACGISALLTRPFNKECLVKLVTKLLSEEIPDSSSRNARRSMI